MMRQHHTAGFLSAMFLVISCALIAPLMSAPLFGEDMPRRSLSFATGSVVIGDKLATINLPPGLRFLGPADARYVLEEIWKNPHDPTVLGLVLPSNDEQSGRWAAVVSYSADGHVLDNDAANMDFSAILSTMQEQAKESAAAMRKTGQTPYTVNQWAEAPHYDKEQKILFWATDLSFEGQKGNTLNYCMRVLGARGTLELNVIDSITELPNVATAGKQLLAATAFTPGNAYADFKNGTDYVKEGGIAALVAGGLIGKKLGFFALIGVFLVKFWKLLLIPLVAVPWIIGKIRAHRATKARNEARARLAAQQAQASSQA